MQVPSTRLYWRMALYIGAALAAFTTLAVGSVMLVASQELQSYTATRHSTLGREAADVLTARGREGLARWLEREARVPEGVTVYILDERSVDILGRRLPEFYAGFIRRSVVGPPQPYDSNYRPVRLAPQLIGRDGRTYAFLVLPNRISLLGNAATTLGLLLAACVVVATVAWLIARAFARPLGELQRVVREIASGQIGARVPQEIASRRDELGALAGDFNSMADRLGRLIEGRSRLMAELSHELRSPLARMQAALALEAHRAPGALPERERLEAEIRRIDAVIGDLLRYSRLDAATPIARRLLRLDGLLAELVRDEELEAGARGVELRLSSDEELVVAGDSDLLRSGFENVLRNAIRFAPRGSLIEIEAHGRPTEVVVTIADRGPGVPTEWLERMFEPYARAPQPGGDESAAAPGAAPSGDAAGVEGTGLGLAIARRVFLSHDGTAVAALRDGGGLIVTLRLPRAEVS
jgi:two-component system sensor histidine kinase CpxA